MSKDVYPGTLDCVHCGLCLGDCPTYRITGRETASPRGRIYLMRGVAEGEIALDSGVAEALDQCLGCRACESACPSGVRYGAMLEDARAALSSAGLRRGWGARIERFTLRELVPHRKRLHAFVSMLGLVQRLRLDRLVAPLLPPALRRAQGMLPAIPPPASRRRLPHFTQAEGERRGCVALLEGCVMSELFGDVNRATVEVLAANGFDVVVPREQGCCGALQAHSGDKERARTLAHHNVRAFASHDGQPFDAVVQNSAGCGAALRELPHWIGDEGEALSSRVRDVCEWLDEVGLRPPRGRLEARVCYDDPCHLIHGQQVEAAPRRLLSQIDGVELVAHADASACCGAAGTYNLMQPELSARILDEKMQALAAVSPDIVATGNPGCLLQLRSGAKQRGLRMRIAHPVELLAASYRESDAVHNLAGAIPSGL
jgi:Fe-S oxidoreductase